MNLNAARAALRRVREANILQKNLKKKVEEARNTYRRKLKEKQNRLPYGSLPHNAELYKPFINMARKHGNAYNNYAHLAHNFLNMMKTNTFRSPKSRTLNSKPRYPLGNIGKSKEKKIKNYAQYLARLHTISNGRLSQLPANLVKFEIGPRLR
jgi:hypothetical protein